MPGRKVLVMLLVLASPALATPPPDTDSFVAKAMQEFGAPGLSLAIVENGRTVLAKGYGVRRIGTQAAVDAHTAFPIGSETKAFTAAALAILVDRHKLTWSDHVVDRLPGFAMYDPYATAHMTIRDLLTHRSGLGLGEGDLLVVPGTLRSRADVVHALRYLAPVTGFRETFAYDNILYIVAGALVQSVSGQSWEDFVTQNILAPAGMEDSRPNYDPVAPNAVTLHARTSEDVRGTGPESVLENPPGFHTIAPAGGMNASAADMAVWMSLQLGHGKLPNGRQVFSAEQAMDMLTPVVVVPADEFKLPPEMADMQPDLQSYALGWFVEIYHGHLVIEHSGAVFGALAMQYLIPDRNIGISVAINSEDTGTRRAVMFHVLDYYLGLPTIDWISRLHHALDHAVAGAKAALHAAPSDTAVAGAPARPADDYTGSYIDPWYGSVTIARSTPGQLTIRFDQTPGMSGALTPSGGNRWQTHWTDHNIENAFVDFAIADGHVHTATLRPVSPLADFSFDYQDLHLTKR